jgi:hypothetical protein
VSSAWLTTLAPITGIVVNAALQLLVAHTMRRTGLAIIIGFVGGLAATLIQTASNISQATTLADAIAVWPVVVLSYLGLSYNYWVFINLNITSLRIRTLRDLLHQSQGVPLSQLTAQYSVEEMLDRRLERLEHGKQIAYADGRWQLVSGRVLLLLHRTLGVMRAIVLPASK